MRSTQKFPSFVALIIILVFFVHAQIALGSAIAPPSPGPPSGSPPPGAINTTPCPKKGPAPACDPSSAPFRCDDYSVYRCANNECGSNKGGIEQTTGYYQCITTYYPAVVTDENGCQAWKCDSSSGVESGPFLDQSAIQPYSKAGTYQACPASSNDWSPVVPEYQCSGKCYPAPEIRALNDIPLKPGDAPLSPQNVFENPMTVKLPVNIGISNSFSPAVQTEFANESCTIDQYQYSVTGGPTDKTGYTNTTNQSLQRENFLPSCALIPGVSSYSATAQACLNGKCGAESDPLAFSTSKAPELKSPYDPDWEGPKSATDPTPVILEWCKYPTTDPPVQSFAVNAYKTDAGGAKKGNSVLFIDGVPGDETLYDDSYEAGHFNNLKKGITYLWEVAACANANATGCSVFSQLWSLIPGKDLEQPSNLRPSSGAFLNMRDSLSWQEVSFASHYIARIGGQDFFMQDPIFYLTKNMWPPLLLNTNYSWKVAGCWGAPDSTDISDCKNQDGTIPWSGEQTFTTTGASPTNLTETPQQTAPGGSIEVGVPTILQWDAMPGAASYKYELKEAFGAQTILKSSATQTNSVDIDPADILLQQGKQYEWSVKTCADTAGTVCGISSSHTFSMTTLLAPTITAPGAAETLPYITISWNKVFGEKLFYRYQILYDKAAPDETQSCVASVGTPIETTPRTTQENKISNVRLRCTGDYTLKIQACFDQDKTDATKCGTETGPISEQMFFVKPAPTRGTFGGLIVCDASNDNKSTPWDDRQPCELKHIFLLIRTLIDFAMWKVVPILAALYTLFTGVLVYFSLGDANILTKVKQIWRAFGVGVLIMLFAWTFMNIVLGLLGFNINFYGHWHQIPL